MCIIIWLKVRRISKEKVPKLIYSELFGNIHLINRFPPLKIFKTMIYSDFKCLSFKNFKSKTTYKFSSQKNNEYSWFEKCFTDALEIEGPKRKMFFVVIKNPL